MLSERTQCVQLKFKGSGQRDEFLGKTRAVLGGLWGGVGACSQHPSMAQHTEQVLYADGPVQVVRTDRSKGRMDTKEKEGSREGGASAVGAMIWICFISSASNLF